MGNSDSSSGGGSSGSGLNDHCYQVGYEHGSQSTNPDPVGDGLAAAPCTITKEANAAYARGYTDAMGVSGVNSGDQNTRRITTSADYKSIRENRLTYTTRNGNTYTGGKLTAFVASNGTKYRVKSRMDNR